MKYELRKIIGNRYFCISLVLSLVVNGFFLLSTYNGDRSGYTLTELKKAYSNIDQLKTKQADLDAAITGLCEYRGDLLTGDIYEEYFLVSTTIERIAEAKEYSDHLSNILAELQVKINSGLFGNTESYSVKAFRAVMHQYEKLKNINIPISFSGAIEILSGWEVSDILIFLFCCTAALLLTTSERKNGSLGLLYSTENGRSKLYIQKYFATEVIYALTFLLMHGCNISLTCITLGYGDIMRPIQSVYGFSDCPFGFTVFGYFVFYYLIKFLWGLSVSTLFFAFCSATHNFILPIFSIGSIFLFSYACEFSHVLYFHFLNLIHLAKTEDLFKSCIMLNFGGRPISHLIVLFFELALISLLSFTFGMIHFCSKQMANKTRGKRNAHPFSALRHTNLFIHEGTKIYIHNHALIIIVTFVILQVCVYREFTVTLNETEVEYKRYSDILTGLPNKEKKHYLESEMAYFEDLETQLFLLEERFGEDKAILSLIS